MFHFEPCFWETTWVVLPLRAISWLFQDDRLENTIIPFSVMVTPLSVNNLTLIPEIRFRNTKLTVIHGYSWAPCICLFMVIHGHTCICLFMVINGHPCICLFMVIYGHPCIYLFMVIHGYPCMCVFMVIHGDPCMCLFQIREQLYLLFLFWWASWTSPLIQGIPLAVIPKCPHAAWKLLFACGITECFSSNVIFLLLKAWTTYFKGLYHKRKPYGLGSQREESVLIHLSRIWFSFYAMVLLNLGI